MFVILNKNDTAMTLAYKDDQLFSQKTLFSPILKKKFIIYVPEGVEILLKNAFLVPIIENGVSGKDFL